jgi:pimeloyl-ACP methyl ester carboxylesterase
MPFPRDFLNLEIDVCVRNILNAIQGDIDPILIGSSLGGRLAAKVALEHSAVKMLILLNPAIIPPQADTSRIKGIPERILSEMRDDQLFDKKIGAQTTILMATKDEVIPRNWILDFAVAQEATVKFLNDDHAFTSNLTRLPDIIDEILSLRKSVS